MRGAWQEERRRASWPALFFCLLAALQALQTAADLTPDNVWFREPGFSLELYAPGRFGLARALAQSGANSAGGPIITYSGSLQDTTPVGVNAMVDLFGRGEADYWQPIVPPLAGMTNGIAWSQGSLFIAATDPYKWCKLYRLDNVDSYALGRKTAKLSDLVLLRDDLPFDMSHGWRYIRFGPDGKLYFAIGSNCNSCRVDAQPPNNGFVNGQLIFNPQNAVNTSRSSNLFQMTPQSPIFQFATIYRFNRDGSNPELVASGVRNSVGFDWHPTTGQLYFTDNGRDFIGGSNANYTDNHPDCELNVLTAKGQDFGFPYCFTGPSSNDSNLNPYLRPVGVGRAVVDPNWNAGETAMKCDGPNLQYRRAIQAMGPHVAPLGLRFYRWRDSRAFPSSFFPKAYDKTLLICQHGSYNRQVPIGARLMQVTLDPKDLTKVLSFRPFMTGGLPGDKGAVSGPDPPVPPGTRYNGRPTDLTQLPDGSILISDDYFGNVYRISYRQPSACRTPKNGRDATSNVATLRPTLIAGTAQGCRVNVGKQNAPRFRRCVSSAVPNSVGRPLRLATSLVVLNGRLVLRTALVLTKFTCMAGNSSWVGFGLPPRQDQVGMVGTRAYISQPASNTTTGASTASYYLAGADPKAFRKNPVGFLASANSLQAYMAGQSLVTTADIVLPYAFQLAAFNAKKLPKRPVKPRTAAVLTAGPTNITFLLALGDSQAGVKTAHYYLAQVVIPFLVADIGASVAPGVPVINRGAAPGTIVRPPDPRMMPTPTPTPTPSPSPSPSPAGPLTTACSSGPSCLGGLVFQTCMADSGPGFLYRHCYTVVNGTLLVGIEATWNGWAGWAYNTGTPGNMVGSNAFIVRRCGSTTNCPTGASTPQFLLGGTDIGVFSPISSFNRIGSGTNGSIVWATFSLPWPVAGSSFTINYGGGAYTGGTPSTVNDPDGMSMHAVFPPPACVSQSVGGMADVVGGACSSPLNLLRTSAPPSPPSPPPPSPALPSPPLAPEPAVQPGR